MKIIHTADLHLDSAMETHLTAEKAGVRKAELLQTFVSMTEYACKNGVSAIIIAGDLFDTEGTEQKRIKQQVFSVIRENSKILFIYTKGNHDKDSSFENMAKELKNLAIVGNDSSKALYLDNKRICISGNPSTVFAEETLNILSLHGDINSSINLKELSPNIDYLALGHLHSYKWGKLFGRGIWCYSGCLEGRGFDETGEKGFVLLDIEGKKISHQFVPFSKRSIHKIDAVFSGYVSFKIMSEKLALLLENIPSKDLVEIELKGGVTEDSVIDVEGLKELFDHKFFCLRIKNCLEIQIDYTKYKNDISLKGEFVRVVEKMNIPDVEKQQVIYTGLSLLAGRENF